MKDETSVLMWAVMIVLLVGTVTGFEVWDAYDNKEFWQDWVTNTCSWSSRPERCREVMCSVPKGYDWKAGMGK